MPVDLLPWDALAPSRRLFLAHLRGDDAARALFGRGSDDGAALDALHARGPDPVSARAALADRLEAYAATLDVEGAVDAARRMRDPRAVCVVAGQQPTVGGGPLLAYAKALGAIALARRLERASGRPVVPVWWVASEDHDVTEAGAVLLEGGRRGSDLLKGTPPDRTMLARVRADGDAAPLGLAAARAFAAWFAGEGLVVLEPHAIRALAVEAFRRDIEDPGALAACVRAGNDRVRAAGFAPALDDPAGPLHFVVDPSGRRSRGGGTAADLADADRRLSADVALRVLAQDMALPVVAQMAGPAEAEYLAALGPLHEATGTFRPAVIARPGVTVLERRIEVALAGFGATVEELYRRGGALLEGAPPEPAGPDPLAAAVGRAREEVRSAVGDRAARPAAVRSRAERADRALAELAAAAERAAAEARGLGATRRRRVLDALLPDGVPQERRWTPGPFLRRHGPALASLLAEACSGTGAGHRVVRPAPRADDGATESDGE